MLFNYWFSDFVGYQKILKSDNWGPFWDVWILRNSLGPTYRSLGDSLVLFDKALSHLAAIGSIFFLSATSSSFQIELSPNLLSRVPLTVVSSKTNVSCGFCKSELHQVGLSVRPVSSARWQSVSVSSSNELRMASLVRIPTFTQSIMLLAPGNDNETPPECQFMTGPTSSRVQTLSQIFFCRHQHLP